VVPRKPSWDLPQWSIGSSGSFFTCSYPLFCTSVFSPLLVVRFPSGGTSFFFVACFGWIFSPPAWVDPFWRWYHACCFAAPARNALWFSHNAFVSLRILFDATLSTSLFPLSNSFFLLAPRFPLIPILALTLRTASPRVQVLSSVIVTPGFACFGPLMDPFANKKSLPLPPFLMS